MFMKAPSPKIPKHVFAVGARVGEIPLEIAVSQNVARGECSITMPNVRAKKRAIVHQLLGCRVPPFAPISMDANDPYTMSQAYEKRLFRDHPAIQRDVLARFRLHCREQAKRFRGIKLKSLQECLQNSNFNENRKKQYLEAFDKLRGGFPTKRWRTGIKSFGKRENYPCYKHLRMINSRSDPWKAWVMPYIKAIEEKVYQDKWFIKHVPVRDRPVAISKLCKYVINQMSGDYAAYESVFKQELEQASVGELIDVMLEEHPEAAKLIIKTDVGDNYMSTRIGVKAHCKARRMSGDLWTSLGNGWHNMCALTFIAAEKNAYIDGYVEGDDSVFITDAEITAADFAQLGMTMTLNPGTGDTHYQPRNVMEKSFCGVVCTDDLQIMRDPREFMSKFGWSTSFIGCNNRIKMELLRAKALSTCNETPHCPIVRPLAQLALKLTRGVNPRFVFDGYHNIQINRDESNLEEFAPTMPTRVLFQQLYGITVDQQIQVEKYIADGQLDRIQQIVQPNADMIHYNTVFVEQTG